MEQRREPRFRADQKVQVTILGERESRIEARVRNISGRGLGLEVPAPIAPGAALKIDILDAMVLAEVVFCRNEQSSYFVGVALEQVLSGLSELGRVLQQYADEPSRTQPVYTMEHRREQDDQ